MKIINFKRAVCAVLIASFFVVYPSMSKNVNAAEQTGNIQTPDVQVLRVIDIVELPASIQILLEAGNSLKYTSFILMDPPRLVVDLPGVSLGEFTKSIIDVPTMTPVQSDNKAPVKPQLNMVRELIFNESGNKDSFKIIAENIINADTFIVDGDKLVVDVKDADNSIKSFENVVESKLI